MLLSELPQSLRDSPLGEGARKEGANHKAFRSTPSCFCMEGREMGGNAFSRRKTAARVSLPLF